MEDLRTAGEKLCKRSLSKEKVAGVQHYVVGQHYAEVTADMGGILTALLSWVDQHGNAVAMPVRKRGNEWQPYGFARKGGQSVLYPVIDVRDYNFSEEQLHALRQAEERYGD